MANIILKNNISHFILNFEQDLCCLFFKAKNQSAGIYLLYFEIRPGQTCHSKVMHRKEVTHSDGTYEEKSRRWTWLAKWDKEKIPWYTHRMMHRKRVTSELHDSYFRLVTIKHAIPRIEWAIEWVLNYYITQSRQEVRQLERLETRVVGKATPGRRGPRLSCREVADKMQ